MLVKNLESKMKLSFSVAIASLIFALAVTIIAFFFTRNMIAKERSQIYILDNNVPIVAKKSDMLDNREAEYKNHITAFHENFFSMTPDNKQIEYQMNKAMNLIDLSGVKQYNALKEKGFFTNIITSSTVITLMTDSVYIDYNTLQFRYFGTERIERPSMRTIRNLVTEGTLTDVPRSLQNPHGCLITNWKTLENKDISNEAKKLF